MGKVVYIPIFPAVLDVLNRRQAGKVLNPKGFVFPELAAKYEHDATGDPLDALRGRILDITGKIDSMTKKQIKEALKQLAS